MPLVVAYEDIKPEAVIHNREGGPDRPAAKVYPFFWAPKDQPEEPSAFLVRYELGTQSSAHYHAADQIQLVMEGRGMLGHHELTPYGVHFARAYTPYGPLFPDKQEGWAFLTLRTRADPQGAQRLSTAKEKLRQIPGRQPWQVSSEVPFAEAAGGVAMLDVPAVRDDKGLFTKSLVLAPGASTSAPDPSQGDGQYIVVVKGSLLYDGREYKAVTVAFTRRGESAFEIRAGEGGLSAIIINFPKPGITAESRAMPAASTEYKVWQCELCAFVYDEEQGMPDDGIAPGTRWADVPETWTCPDCGVGKADFQMVGL